MLADVAALELHPLFRDGVSGYTALYGDLERIARAPLDSWRSFSRRDPLQDVTQTLYLRLNVDRMDSTTLPDHMLF
jgi:hypothetical protein